MTTISSSKITTTMITTINTTVLITIHTPKTHAIDIMPGSTARPITILSFTFTTVATAPTTAAQLPPSPVLLLLLHHTYHQIACLLIC